MTKRNIIISVGIVVLAVGWYAFRPELLFVNKAVNEEFPGGAAMASIEKEPMAVTKGNFKGLAHETKGLASIYQLADGKRTLRLTEFETSNGPDVHVYLTAAEVEKGSDAIKEAGFIDLGSMKGNKGDQNYDIPVDADLNKYKNVTIWCARFGVNFGQAALEAPVSIPVKVVEGNFRGASPGEGSESLAHFVVKYYIVATQARIQSAKKIPATSSSKPKPAVPHMPAH
jgi:hypothetical protein